MSFGSGNFGNVHKSDHSNSGPTEESSVTKRFKDGFNTPDIANSVDGQSVATLFTKN